MALDRRERKIFDAGNVLDYYDVFYAGLLPPVEGPTAYGTSDPCIVEGRDRLHEKLDLNQCKIALQSLLKACYVLYLRRGDAEIRQLTRRRLVWL